MFRIVVVALHTQLLNNDAVAILIGIRLEESALLRVVVGHEGQTATHYVLVVHYHTSYDTEQRVGIVQMFADVPQVFLQLQLGSVQRVEQRVAFHLQLRQHTSLQFPLQQRTRVVVLYGRDHLQQYCRQHYHQQTASASLQVWEQLHHVTNLRPFHTILRFDVANLRKNSRYYNFFSYLCPPN